jgi:hypothetical protein
MKFCGQVSLLLFIAIPLSKQANSIIIRITKMILVRLQMLGFAKPNPQPPNREATYRVTVISEMEADLTEAVYRMRCNRQTET